MKRSLPFLMTAVLTGSILLSSIAPAIDSKVTGRPALLSFEELNTLYEHETLPAPLNQKLADLLSTPFVENGAADRAPAVVAASAKPVATGLRVAHWNIERGIAYDDILAALSGRDSFAKRLGKKQLDLKERAQALEEAHLLSQADVIILNEVDWGLKRSDYRNVAQELAAALGMNYAFGVEFVEVDPLTLGTNKLEDEIEDHDEMLRQLTVDPQRTIGLHGNAILSRYPLTNVRIVRFQTQGHDWFEGEKKQVSPLEKGKRKTTEVAFLEKVMREVRRGGRMMMMAEIEDVRIPGGRATIVNAHLEAKTKPENRRRQLEEVLTAIKPITHPVILAGDLNTSGSDATPTSVRREIFKRLGSATFWAQYGIKWATGFGLLYDTTRTAVNFSRTYSDPTVRSIKFISENNEAEFFKTLEEFRFADGGAFDFRGESQRSAAGHAGKLANSNERAEKGFKPTYEPERSFKIARLKLDWIFVKPPGLTKPEDEAASHVFAPQHGRTLQTLNYSLGERISDHNPMIVDLPFAAEVNQARK